MAGTPELAAAPRLEGSRVLIVEARYYEHINDHLLAGVRAMLERAGVIVRHVVVPGALEIPPAIALAHASGSFAGYVAVGCVIRGETTHYELVSGESCRGIMDLGVRHGALVGNGILTVENEEQALVRADPARENKGGHAALAALKLIALRRDLAANEFD